MSNETKQHTPEWACNKIIDLISQLPEDDYDAGQIIFDIQRIASMGATHQFSNKELSGRANIELLKEIEELEKYKTACEAINKDNPMAVAENLKYIVGYLELFPNLLRSEGLIEDSKNIERLLTKIQEK